MNLGYADIFAQRGHDYHAAMSCQPQARRREFEALFSATPVQAGQRVLDVPAGGGYLQRYLPCETELCSLELTSGFGTDLPQYDPARTWTHGRFEHAVCLAALHHIEDQDAFLRGLLDRLTPDGTLHLADVRHGSGIAGFLDGFVGRHNLTGHAGRYLRLDHARFAALGRVSRLEEIECPWHFASLDALAGFCSRLFGLVDCPGSLLLDALSDSVGIERHGAQVSLRWRLLYVDLHPAATG
ncbi:class I SAM-dependent methyltransferase [Lysobacter solisilvae (ex Woo and Kim 2020)]|uniref:Class I SAM-dependent methyltransferase n=1 Tax=Agrilutibacter terrestris TaxID=2865112 RepID=A0A7H0FZF0_9GAMM|nr:methyltransferase domain-containing protein [Lysobacter terrestris]QNP41416.1 hypothetical protein H8B22_04115 [Lysobacter terrestris]